MMILSDVHKRFAMILALVMIVALVGCSGSSDEGASGSSSSGERTPCSECESMCEGADNPVDCLEACLRDCTP